MANLAKMMKKAAAMQKEMAQMQSQLAETTVEGTSGGGMVVVTAKGDGSIQKIKIDPQVVNPEEVEMLEDLVLSAVQNAAQKAQELTSSKMGEITAGLDIPGLPG